MRYCPRKKVSDLYKFKKMHKFTVFFSLQFLYLSVIIGTYNKNRRKGVTALSKMDDLEKHLIDKPEKSKSDHVLLDFFLGLLLLGIGLFMVFQMTDVQTSWHTWYIGSWGVPTGVVVIPLLIGIGMLFFNFKSIIGWIVSVLGIAIILVTIIMSVEFVFRRTSLFLYILMFGTILAGTGLLLRSLFRKPKKDD